jgi:hypothetical protein
MVAPKVQARLFEDEHEQVAVIKRPEPSPADEKLRGLLSEAPSEWVEEEGSASCADQRSETFAAHMAAYELAKALEVVSELLAAVSNALHRLPLPTAHIASGQ